MTKARRAARRARLKRVPPVAALDFGTLHLSAFAQDLGAGLDRPLDVLFYFAESIRAGYAPPDELLHWLGERFAAYLADPKGRRLDECLGLAPGTGRNGTREARTRDASARRESTYTTRLAILDFAGFAPKVAVLSLNEGVPGILGPIDVPGKPYSPESLVAKASAWRKSRDYEKHFEWLTRHGGKIRVIEQLRAVSTASVKRK